MKIAKITDKDRDFYNELAREYGTVFNTLKWNDIYDGAVKLYGIYDKGNSLIGGFSLYEKKVFGLTMCSTPPFTPYIGPFLKVEARNPVSIMDLWKKTLSEVSNFVSKMDYPVITISLNKGIVDAQPFIWSDFKVVPSYTYVIDLEEPVDELIKKMSSERRKNIRKGVKDGLVVRQVNNYSIIRTLVLKTFSRQNEKIDEVVLDKILFKFAGKGNSFAFVTYREDVPISCTFCIYDKDTAYYILGGYDSKGKHHGAGALSMIEAIKYSQMIKMKYFDFEGSMIPQVEKYFRGFGGSLTPFYRVNKAKMPLEIVLKFLKRSLF